MGYHTASGVPHILRPAAATQSPCAAVLWILRRSRSCGTTGDERRVLASSVDFINDVSYS